MNICSFLGLVAFAAAHLGGQSDGVNAAAGPDGMGSSYVLLLTAFYVDNGRRLPVWKSLPVWTYWLLPALVGMPVIVWALWRHPVVMRSSGTTR